MVRRHRAMVAVSTLAAAAGLAWLGVRRDAPEASPSLRDAASESASLATRARPKTWLGGPRPAEPARYDEIERQAKWRASWGGNRSRREPLDDEVLLSRLRAAQELVSRRIELTRNGAQRRTGAWIAERTCAPDHWNDGMGADLSSTGPPGHDPHDARILSRARYTRVFASSHFRRSSIAVARSQRCPVARSSDASARHALVQSLIDASSCPLARSTSDRAARSDDSRRSADSGGRTAGGACEGIGSAPGWIADSGDGG